ncbi:hypothetical protein D3Z36_12770 [Lachnospiraceae bacterium]|nr:hypothetical protein [Lachnospiraceae bacterium]
MTFEEWKKIKAIRGEDNRKIIRDFERSNPGLAALFAQKEQDEIEKMRQIMTEPDRKERWKQIAKATYNPEFAARRRREEM